MDRLNSKGMDRLKTSLTVHTVYVAMKSRQDRGLVGLAYGGTPELVRLGRRLGWQPSPPPFIGRPGAIFKIFEVVEVKGHLR